MSLFGAKLAVGIGGAVFGRSKRKKSERAAKKQQLASDTQSAYSTTGNVIGSLRARTQTTQTEYTSTLGIARARMAASGASLDSEAWSIKQGEIAGERDNQMDAIGKDRTALESSAGYGLVRDDYNRMVSGQDSVAGESIFSKSQQSNIKRYDGGSEYLDTRYGEYKKSITPTLQEYETLRFGSTEEKNAMTATIDDRITGANEVWKESSVMNAVNDEYKKRRD